MRRYVGAWLGTWALLLHGLAPAGASLSGAGSVVDPLLGPVVICTAFGPRVLPPPAEDAPRAAAFDHCILCLSDSAGKLAPPARTQAMFAPDAAPMPRPQGRAATPAPIVPSGFLARGPPGLV